MLQSLIIEHFAIVTRLELDFSSGMTAFTGETGAGKSIMIDALMLAMGGRADAAIVRTGEKQCQVSALFDFEPDSEPALWLQAHDIESPENEVWLRRVIYAEGRSKAYINGTPLPTQKVKAFSELLLDIHGQHQHQRLLKPATHRLQLDQYANHPALLHAVETRFSEYQAIQAEKKLADSKTKDTAQAEFLRYQITELEALELTPDELTELNQEHQYLHHAKSYLDTLARIYQLLNTSDMETPDVQTNLHHIAQMLDTLPQDNAHLTSARELIQSALIQCEEANHEIEQFADRVQLDPERLGEIEARLSKLHDAARKYQTKPDLLCDKLSQLQQEEASLEHIEAEQLRLQNALNEAYQAYQTAAFALRASREKHASLLAEEITAALQTLGIHQGVIQIRITPTEHMHAHGLDHVEYDVSTNPGIAPHPLTKVASGGELSRISLAIQVITAKRAQTPTLFFDEVDVGIGGETAARVGKLLRTLGERLQVFCVTHQPQVAAAAHQHMLVKKYMHDNQTFSEVKMLNPIERAEEISRMLGGHNMNEETRQHAKALLLEY